MDNQSKPTISVSISITPATHLYANKEASNLNLIITSHFSEPITIYADDHSPSLMLACGAFTITCLNNGCEIRQACRTHCRIPPPTKVAVTLNESLFHTLLPNEPITISAPFSRNRPETGGKPLAKSGPNYVSDRVRASFSASSVDGLEPGNDYVLTLGDSPHVHWKTVRWWDFGTKERVLHPDGKESSLNGREVKWGRAPHEAIEIDTTSIGPIMFRCRE